MITNLSERDYYSFVIMRPEGRGSFALRIKKWILFTILTGLVVFIFTVSYAIYFYLQTNVERIDYKRLRDETITQRHSISDMDLKIDSIKNTLEDLIEKEEQINYILETESKSSRKYPKKKLSKALNLFRNQFIDLKKSDISIETMLVKLDCIKIELTRLEETFNDHYFSLVQLKTRYASTPSIWPVPGYVKSGYGYRTHPITGRKKLHQGIDIPSWVGAPIQAAADGIVEHSGWAGGFGYTVVISHGYGYQTLYAHTSKTLVKKGELVKKGQTIAQVGTTGLSTGPHLHYEVRRWRKTLLPNAYLNPDMFTASTRLW